MFKNIFIILILVFFVINVLTISCLVPQPTATSYQPEKAKAVILGEYDISDYYNLKPPLNNLDEFMVKFSECNNVLYIFSYIYDSINKSIDPCFLLVNKTDMSKIDYYKIRLENHYPVLYSSDSHLYCSGIAVTNNNIFSKLIIKNNDFLTYFILKTDLNGKNIKVFDNSDDIGIGLLNNLYYFGYNRISKKLYTSRDNLLSCYNYDQTNDIFKKEFEFNMNKTLRIKDTNDKKIVTEDYQGAHTLVFSILEIRDINELDKVLFRVNTYYLGGISVRITDAIYCNDGYLWIIVNRNQQLQLLKLQPTGIASN
ncbi:MAG TPA: hypothetical protein PK771_13245 [Spirochaetota bacterium]|nr:hypothetical protein [Spirochaetota bacterium]